MIYLVIAAAVILGEPTLIPPDDCIRVRKIEVAKPHPVKRVLVHKRLFRGEPKPVIEEGCEEEPRPTVTTFFPPVDEPPTDFTPAPPETFAAPQIPGEREPGEPVATGIAPLAGAAFITYASYAAPCCCLPFIAAPVPEPAISYLLLAGLGALGFIRWKRT